MMGEEIPRVRGSKEAEDKLRELGDIFLKAILPEKVKKEIIEELPRLAEGLSGSKDEESARKYLLALKKKLS